MGHSPETGRRTPDSHNLQKTSMSGDLWQSNCSGAGGGGGAVQRTNMDQEHGDSAWGLLIYKAEQGWETQGPRDKAKGMTFWMEVA